MSSPRRTAPGTASVDGVLVVGMHGSGVGLVGDICGLLGLRRVEASTGPLSAFNDRLLLAAGGTEGQLPPVGPREAAQLLRPLAAEGRDIFHSVVGPSGQDAGTPWAWADPRLSLLGMFWAQALAISPAIVLVHRDPVELGGLGAGAGMPPGDAEVAAEWDRVNRAAMAECFTWPSLVVPHHALREQTKSQVQLFVEFLEHLGVSPVDGGAESAVDALETAAEAGATFTPLSAEALTKDHHTLHRILGQMDGVHTDPEAWKNDARVLDEVASFYDEDYYGASYDTTGIPYSRQEEHWVTFFAATARAIVSGLHPRTVLDVGCATGMLVEALRDEGVDARGVDVSRWAIDHVPDALRPYCTLGTVTEEIIGTYDLITCIEVAEHLPAFAVEGAIANLCRHADAVLFSSTPDDFDEPTHLNVESSGYWAELFVRQGFLRDADFDASFLAAHAVLFRRSTTDVTTLVFEYEKALGRVVGDAVRGRAAIAEHARLADRYNTLAADNSDLAAEYARVADQLRELSEREGRRRAEEHALHEKIAELNAHSHQLFLALNDRTAELAAVRSTKTFRYTAILRRVYGKVRRVIAPAPAPVAPAVVHEERTYALWAARFDTIDDEARAAIRARVDRLAARPLVSIIFPVYNTPARYLQAAVESVLDQIYTNWELCIADDCSTEPHVAETLAAFAARDPRIKITRRSENGHISAASNSALELATGEWVVPLDHDDVLAEHALALAMLAVDGHDDAAVIYSDEDKIDDQGNRQLPYFKPDFDPLLLLGQNYLTHLLFLRRSLVTAAGGYRLGYEGSQDWDLILRVTETLEPSQIVHVPHVLYHWRIHDASTASQVSVKPYALDSGQRAVADHLARRHLEADVTRIPSLGHNRVTWRLPDDPPLVSIIIPTKDGTMLRRCIDSLLAFTSYPNFEILVIDNGSSQYATLEFLREHEQHMTIIRDERPFNYSALNNAAVQRAAGDLVCLLNDDTEVIAADWLTEMVGQILVPGVGAVGAKLYYPDGRIQHGGVIVGLGGVAGHSHRMSDRLAPGYCGRLLVAQSLSAVTGACMLVRREAWDQVGGLDEDHLAVAFNDVDFGLRLREAGWRITWTPHATLYHHESVSRGPDDVGPRVHAFAKEIEYVQERWGEGLLRDPAYNPNLTLDTENFDLSWPPRVSYR